MRGGSEAHSLSVSKADLIQSSLIGGVWTHGDSVDWSGSWSSTKGPGLTLTITGGGRGLSSLSFPNHHAFDAIGLFTDEYSSFQHELSRALTEHGRRTRRVSGRALSLFRQTRFRLARSNPNADRPCQESLF